MERKNILVKILLKVYKYRFFGGMSAIPEGNPVTIAVFQEHGFCPGWEISFQACRK